MKELGTRTFSGAGIVVAILCALMAGPHTFFGLIVLIFVTGCIESERLSQDRRKGLASLLSLAAAILLILIYLSLNFGIPVYWLGIPALLAILAHFYPAPLRTQRRTLLWLALPLSAWYGLGWFNPDAAWNPALPLALIILIWVNDIFAYLTGSLLGKHKLAPRLSPGKTWEGAAGGLFFSCLAAWGFVHFHGYTSALPCFLLAPLISLSGLAGDLYESGLKRRFNVKDSSQLIPGHGGMLDRFDSLLFAAPLVFLCMILLSLVP